MRELEPVIKYKMDQTESKAYKIALIWQEECRREIPNEPFVKLKANSDPRKSLLFKYCYKLAKEMKGILQDSDLQLYVRSQIQVLKSISDGKVHALIEPHCLVGEKAWRRWKMWKYRRDKILSKPSLPGGVVISPTEGKARAEISSTKEFLSRAGCLDFDSMSANSASIPRWVKSGEVSGFYVVLSPWMREIFPDPKIIDTDRLYYRASTTPAIEKFFGECFVHEFKKKDTNA